jgi:hypothetical protein
MKRLTLLWSLPLALAALTGCNEGFPDEEMHLGLDAKVRPYAVVIEPAEAAPGETVQVTLLARAPQPDELDVTWRVALDYDLGLYETDEIERNTRSLAVPSPTADADGLLRQTFAWVVPDSALLYASALPAVLTDPALVALAGGLLGPAAGAAPSSAAVDAWLKALTPADLAAMDPSTRAAAWALADRFACQVRFRATLRTGQIVEVTRNLTIRHTGRLGGPNLNHNAEVLDFAVAAVKKRDATRFDLDDPGVPRTWYRFIDTDGTRLADQVQVPLHEDWTYYLAVGFRAEQYGSPFDPNQVVTELGDYHWYYYRPARPASDHEFFASDDGTPAEMWNLGRRARIMPDGAGSAFRVVIAVRDERADWVQYHAVPGTGVAEGIVEFVTP